MESTVVLFNHHVLQQSDILSMYLQILHEHGFIIKQERYIHTLTPIQYQSLGTFIDIHDILHIPVYGVVVQRINAIQNVLQLINDKIFKNTYTSITPYNSLRDQSYYFCTANDTAVERSILLMKPGYTIELYEKMITLLNEHDYIVLNKNICILTTEQIKLITSDIVEAQYLSSDVSIVLLLEKINCIHELNILLGPVDPVEARTNNPDTLRALYGGSDIIHNTLYTPSNILHSNQLISFIFNDAGNIERSILVIKPNTQLHNLVNKYNILFKQYGITIIAQQQLQLTKLRAEQYLSAQHITAVQFNELVQTWCNDVLHVYLVEKVGCFDTLHRLIRDDTAVYTSTRDNALYDINEFFTSTRTQSISTHEQVKQLLSSKPMNSHLSLSDVLVNGLTELCRIRPDGDDAIIWLADWLENNNPYRPKVQHCDGSATDVIVRQNHGRVALDDEVERDTYDLTNKNIIFVTGAPYCNLSHNITNTFNKTNKYTMIDVVQLLKSAAEQHNSTADIIHSYISTHRCVPADIICKLLRSHISSVQDNNIVLANFPQSQDQSFIFEQTIKKPSHVIVVDSTLESTVARASSSGLGNTDKNIVKQKYGTYRDEIILLAEHYTQFNQCTRIQYSDDYDVVQQFKTILQ